MEGHQPKDYARGGFTEPSKTAIGDGGHEHIVPFTRSLGGYTFELDLETKGFDAGMKRAYDWLEKVEKKADEVLGKLADIDRSETALTDADIDKIAARLSQYILLGLSHTTGTGD
jgi:hypothetical protein